MELTVHEVSELTGVTVRALQYYDRIGLLRPAARSEAGYRLYGQADLERLRQILLYRELEFPLREIGAILDSPGFDRDRALGQQIELLTLKRRHLDDLIAHARKIRQKGADIMDFKAFDKKKQEEYARRAKESWGGTDAYREYEEKSRGRSPSEQDALNEALMDIFREFGQIRDREPSCAEAQALVGKLRDFISEHYYRCTKEILAGLGQAYGSGGEFTENIDRAAGEGTGAFAAAAIRSYCG